MPKGKYTLDDLAPGQGKYSAADIAPAPAMQRPQGDLGQQTQSLSDRLTQIIPDSPRMSPAERATNFVGNIGAGAMGLVLHPVKTAESAFASFMPQPLINLSRRSYQQQTGQDWSPDEQALAKTPNPVQGAYQGFSTAPADTLAATIGQAAVAEGAGSLYKGAATRVPGMVKRTVTGNLDAPIPGTNVTPRQRYGIMRETGVQPDAAQATNSPLLQAAKSVNRNSLSSFGLYDKARATNLSALNDYTNQTLNAMSPISDAQAGGTAVQQGLMEHQAGLKSKATAGFQALDEQMGDKPIPGAAALQEQAKNILAQNAEYYRLHPELEPTRATAIVKDLASGGQPVKAPPKVISGFGAASATPPEPLAPRVPTYSELHRLRSDLLDFNKNNPDLVKNQANSWISQLAGAADDAITNSEGGLTPDQVKTFRDANEAWKATKQYDNPQNQLYHAIRNPAPSTLVGGINTTPEMAQNLRGILGERGIGPIQRGVAEKQLGTTPQGNFNFGTFQGKFNRQLSPEYQKSLYTPEQQRQLGNIGQTGSVLNLEANPSGTAKLGQKIAEGTAIYKSLSHPLAIGGQALYHGGQYALGRAMNSPAMVDWLMRQPRPGNANPLIPPILPRARR